MENNRIEPPAPKKRYTMQDIADTVGVSKATVSYVLNNKPGARVSEATRTRILHVANLYNFAPNFVAKYLSTNMDNPVGIVFGSSGRVPDKEYGALVRGLLRHFAEKERHLMLFSADELRGREMKHPLDALIGVDMNHEEIKSLSSRLFVPFILVDCFTDDSLFYAFSTDYNALFRRIRDDHPAVPLAGVFGTYENELYQGYLAELPLEAVHFYHTREALADFLQTQEQAGCLPVFTGAAVALIGQGCLSFDRACVLTDASTPAVFPPDWRVYSLSADRFAGEIVNLLQILAAREEEHNPAGHRIYVL